MPFQISSENISVIEHHQFQICYKIEFNFFWGGPPKDELQYKKLSVFITWIAL